MGDEQDKLRRVNKDLMNAVLDKEAELDEQKCQKKELSFEIVRLHEIVPSLEEENKAIKKGVKKVSKEYEDRTEMYAKQLRLKDEKIQKLETRVLELEEEKLAVQRSNDEGTALLRFTVAQKERNIEMLSLQCDQREEQFEAILRSKNERIEQLEDEARAKDEEIARQKEIIEKQPKSSDKREEEFTRTKSKDEIIEELQSTIKTQKETIEKLQKKIREQRNEFESQLRDKDEKIQNLKSLIRNKDVNVDLEQMFGQIDRDAGTRLMESRNLESDNRLEVLRNRQNDVEKLFAELLKGRRNIGKDTDEENGNNE